ncbi:hypothetical protein, partial [Bradyrhizobium oligotrophicum]|uniref:hypothetical protein n=1 Tax=Bradyrhizobium oligotrophicum TaxID=44255 RepID=UPI003620F396
KPAASVRSEPGSNSQVELEALNRLITTFDEVPPISTHASQRKYHGVTFETLSAEVFSSDPRTKSRSSQS